MQTTTGEETGRPSRRPRLSPRATFILVAAVASLAVLVPAAQVRFIDGDEGFYLMAARLVSQGRRLYSDFFFPQMPLVPQLYGRWFWLFGAGWRTGRVLAALWAVGAGLLLATEARRRTQSWFWGLAALGMYLGSGLVLGWFTIAKTYGLASFLLVAGVVVLQRPSAKAAFSGGLLLALAVGTRLYLVVALPCAALYLLRDRDSDVGRGRRWLAFGAGVLAAGLPLLPSVIRDPRAFYFGNVVFHALRDPGATRLAGQVAQKWGVLLSVLPFKGMEGTFAVQLLGLMVLAVAAALSRATPRNHLPTYLWIALLVTSLLPTPSYPQYFCLLIPFLILDVVALLSTVPLQRLWPFLVPAGIAYAALGGSDGYRYLVSAWQVPGVMTTDRISRWSIPTVERVARQIDAQNAGEAISWWPGYFISTRTNIVPELANDFGMVVAGKLSPAERRRLHLITHAEVGEWIKEHKIPLVVAGNWTASGEGNLLPDHHYEAVARIENVTIWAPRAPR